MPSTYIVREVERLINDTENKHHTIADIEDALNRYRTEARYMVLNRLDTRDADGVVTYLIYTGPRFWDTDVAFVDSQWDTVTPATPDYREGRFVFSTEPNYPVRATGFYYDVYSSAADLLEIRISQLSETAIDASNNTGAGNQNRRYNQQIDNLRNLVARYRSMATSAAGSGMKVSSMYRGDMRP